MIDLRTLREDPEAVRASQLTRGEDVGLVDALYAADERRRATVVRADALRAEQKQLGKQAGGARGEERDRLLARGKELAAEVRAAEAEQAMAEEELAERHVLVPNLVHPEAPSGGEDDYVVLKEVGTPPVLDFEPADHLDLGVRLGALDVERGSKVSGTRSYFLTGVGAQLQLALLNLAAAQATANGFTLMIPPAMARPEMMAATGHLGTRPGAAYRLADDELYLVGTPEVPLAGFHADEILDLSAGPLRYAGWATCFRREPGFPANGSRGIVRAPHFDVFELFVCCRPSDDEAEHARLLAWEEELLTKIEVPYRVTDVPAGDLAKTAARTFACEAWLPSQQRHRQLASTSNRTTFQARRLAIRYRDNRSRPRPAATVNGTLATTHWLAAILENHQRPDGSIQVPAALQPLLGREVLKP